MQFLHFTYSISGSVMIAFYLPQIISCLKAKDRLENISLLSWSVWVICIFNTTCYGVFIIKDLKFSTFAFFNCLACFLVCTITVYKRWKYRHRRPKLSLVKNQSPAEEFVMDRAA